MTSEYLPRYRVGIESGPVVFNDFRRINKIDLAIDGLAMTEEDFKLFLGKDKHYCRLANLFNHGNRIPGPDNRYFLAGYAFFHQTLKRFHFTYPFVVDKLIANPLCETMKVDPSIKLVDEVRFALMGEVVDRFLISVTSKEIIFPVRISDVELSNFMKNIYKGIFRAFFASEYFSDKEDANVFVCHKDKIQKRIAYAKNFTK